MLGISIGRVSLRNTNHPDALSTAAASKGSLGNDWSPAKRIKIANYSIGDLAEGKYKIIQKEEIIN